MRRLLALSAAAVIAILAAAAPAGKSFKGRKCCSRVDAEFRRMEADLHNLVPVVGERVH